MEVILLTACHICVPIFLRVVLRVATGHAVHRMAFNCCSVSEVPEVVHPSAVPTALSTMFPHGQPCLVHWRIESFKVVSGTHVHCHHRF